MKSPTRKIVIALLIAALLSVLAACEPSEGAVQGAVRGARSAGHELEGDADAVGREGSGTPRVVPRVPLRAPSAGSVDDEARAVSGRIVGNRTYGLDSETARDVVAVGCKIHDAYEILSADNESDAIVQATAAFGGERALGLRAVLLAEDLQKQQSDGERFYKVVVASTCEAAG